MLVHTLLLLLTPLEVRDLRSWVVSLAVLVLSFLVILAIVTIKYHFEDKRTSKDYLELSPPVRKPLGADEGEQN